MSSLAANFKQTTYLGYLSLVGVLFLLVAWPQISGGRFLGGLALPQQLLNGVVYAAGRWNRQLQPRAHFFAPDLRLFLRGALGIDGLLKRRFPRSWLF